MELKDAIKDLAEKCLPGNEFFIVETKVTGKANQQKVLVIIDGENGFLVNRNTTTAFAQTIEKALAYNFDNKKIQQQTQSKFNLQNSIQQLQNLFIAACN